MSSEGIGFACGAFLGALVLFLVMDDVTKHDYSKGYCKAINATQVADSLCVRGDSIVARIAR